MSGRKTGLGRGLSALMNDSGLMDEEVPVEASSAEIPDLKPEEKASPTETPHAPSDSSRVLHVSISRLQRNPDQPRKVFNRDQLDDLIASIQQKGVLQPILVRPVPGKDTKLADHWQIVAGERRWQAALKAGLTAVPIIVRDLSDRDVLEIGVIENVQRADLNPLEEAMAYDKLIREFGRTQAEIATTIGKSRVHVANTVRLMGLTERGRELLLGGKITAGHARALLSADDPDALAEAIIKHGWTVRDAENWVKADKKTDITPARKAEKPADIVALEKKISDLTGFAADIRHSGRGGEIRFKYKDLEQMEALLTRLGLKSNHN